MINSASLLERDILSDIEERKQLMLQTKTLYLKYNFSSDHEQFFLNYSIPTIYAIWEGFIQTSFQTYIREINRLELTLENICTPLLVYNAELRFKQFKQYPKERKKKHLFFEKLNIFYKSTTFEIFPIIIDTQSNVGYKVLNRIMDEFNLESLPDAIQPNYLLTDELDRFLLKVRNDVAHGNNSVTVHREDLDRAINLVEILMDEVYVRIKKGFLIDKTFQIS